MTKILKLPTPHYYQRIIYEDPARFKVVACGRRFGKEIPLDTPIFTFNKGFITVGELSVGDYVVSSEGKPTKVIYLSPIELKEGYEFTFSSGEKIQASLTHDWFTYSKLARKNMARIKSGKFRGENNGGKKLTSQEIVDTFRYGKRNEANHAVPVIPVLDFGDFQAKDLPIHPYVLGARLGKTQNSYRKWHYFTDYKKLESPRFMRCIGVEAEDHLFAIGYSFILTHNTELGKILAAKYLLQGKEVYWVSPTYRMSTEVWRSLKSSFQPVVRQKSEQERWMEIYSNGMLRVFSGEHADKIRGGSPHLAIIDEYAFINNSDLWSAVLRPALADNEGSALFLSTPKGKGNGFYEVYQMGRDPDNELYKSWRMPTWYNPFISRNEIIDAKKTLPEKLFLQEFAARFLTDAGEVFVGVSKVATGYRLEPYKGKVVMGVDLGRKGDYTVISVFDSNTQSQVELYRFNKISWTDIRERIIEIYRAWNPVAFLVEQNSTGDVIIDDLRQNGIPVTGFQTTNTSKRQIIEKLALSIQNQELTLLNDSDLIYEFQAMQKGFTSTGLPTYSAPSGSHDDIVIATALSWHALKHGRLMFGSAIPIL